MKQNLEKMMYNYSEYIDVVNESVIEYEMDHTGTDDLELNYSNVTGDYDLIYEFVPYNEYE